MPTRSIGENSISQAVELAKIAFSAQNGQWGTYPEKVGEFVQVVAEKIQQLRDEREQKR